MWKRCTICLLRGDKWNKPPYNQGRGPSYRRRD